VASAYDDHQDPVAPRLVGEVPVLVPPNGEPVTLRQPQDVDTITEPRLAPGRSTVRVPPPTTDQ
jgi:hypothetical protein